MREVHPSLWMNNHIKAHNFFVSESGVLVAPPQMVDVIEEVDVEEVIGKINQFSTFSL
jgi:hypothetical protein